MLSISLERKSIFFR